MGQARKERIDTYAAQLEELFITWGMGSASAEALAYDTAVKIARRVHPSQGLGPRIVLEDRYHSHHDIRIFIRNGCDTAPETVLMDFLDRVKGYPDYERWDVTPRAGGPKGGKSFTAKVERVSLTARTHANVRSKKRRRKEARLEAALSGLSPEDAAAFLKILNATGNSSPPVG